VHSDGRRLGEQFPEVDGVLVEDVSAVGVHVERATTCSGSSSGSDSALCTPHRPTDGPNREGGHFGGHVVHPSVAVVLG
jgi:hypothetical protein